MERFNVPRLGFGMMRLPRNADGTINIEETCEMTDLFLQSGLKYFDTAFVYEGSEEAVRKALVERHPRDSYYLTTKLNAGTWAAKSAEEAKKELEISLERTGAGYFDFYLLHALGEGNLANYENYGIWEFVKEAKEKGLIRHFGFSFHDTPEVLDRILNEHPDAEVVQLQINWADWDNPSVNSRGCYEVASKHGKQVIVMEPVKGGTLVNLPPAIKDLFKAADPDASAASWAIRFAASLENVMVVLSGMSNLAQMQDNVSYMKDFRPLDEEERKVIAKAQEILSGMDQIPCTGCSYCTGGCPMSIHIPDIFNAMNRNLLYGMFDDAKKRYERASKAGAPASACIHCLQCEDACPQHIEITKWLERAAEAFE